MGGEAAVEGASRRWWEVEDRSKVKGNGTRERDGENITTPRGVWATTTDRKTLLSLCILCADEDWAVTPAHPHATLPMGRPNPGETNSVTRSTTSDA